MNITAIVTAISTSTRLRSFITTLRRACPDLVIYVGAQGELNPVPEEIMTDPKVVWFNLPFDHGVSATHNFLVAKTNTEFVLLCDDDFVFQPNFALQETLRLFEGYSDLGVIGGGLTNYQYDASGSVISKREAVGRANKLVLEFDARTIVVYPAIPVNVSANEQPTDQVVFCDYVLNFCIIRRSLVFERGISWDERTRIGGEHLDFFVQLKQAGECRVAYFSGLHAEHHRLHHGPYSQLRQRQIGRQAIFKKLGIEWLVRIPHTIQRMQNDEPIETYSFDRYADVMASAPGALDAVRRALLRT